MGQLRQRGTALVAVVAVVAVVVVVVVVVGDLSEPQHWYISSFENSMGPKLRTDRRTDGQKDQRTETSFQEKVNANQRALPSGVLGY